MNKEEKEYELHILAIFFIIGIVAGIILLSIGVRIPLPR